MYSYDEEGNLIDSDAQAEESSSMSVGNEGQAGILNRLGSAAGGGSSAGAANFSELMTSSDGGKVSPVLTDSYDLLYGSWPEEYNEVILVLNEDNGIPAETLYQLGFITKEQYEEAVEKIENGEEADVICFDYEDICEHKFYLVPA